MMWTMMLTLMTSAADADGGDGYYSYYSCCRYWVGGNNGWHGMRQSLNCIPAKEREGVWLALG